MPTLAALTINDGQTTPVAHTFSPVTSNGRKGEWADRSSTTLVGWRILSNEVLLPATASGAYRNLTLGKLPVEGTVEGTVKVVGQNSFKIEFNFRQEATDQEKKDAIAYAQNYLSNTSVKNAIIAMEPHY
jgi:hypothetical protein